MNKKSLFFKISISIILFGYLVYKIHLDNIYEAFAATNYTLLLLTIPLIAILYLIRAIKWKILLEAIKVNIQTPNSLKIILLGTFYGMFTPAKIGEITRSYFLHQPKAKTFPTVIWDKIIDISILTILSLLALSLFFNTSLLYLLTGILATIIISVIILNNKRLIRNITSKLSLSQKFFKNFYNSMRTISKSRNRLLQVFILTIIYYIITLLIGLITLLAINPNLNTKLVLALPIIILLGNIPLTISGIGTRELVATIIATTLNLTQETGFLFAFLLFILITLIPGLFGFLLNLTLENKFIKLKNIPGNYYNKHKSNNPLLTYVMNKFYRKVNKLVQHTHATKVLDIGCGEGYITKYLAKRNNIQITAADVENTIQKPVPKNIKFEKGNIYKLKYKANQFDLIIANEVLEHLHHPQQALKEIARATKHYALISVPNEPIWCIQNICRLKYLTEFGNTPGHLQNWTKSQFKRLLKRHFKNVKVTTHFGLWNIALCEVKKPSIHAHN